jgi:hypothetical protein
LWEIGLVSAGVHIHFYGNGHLGFPPYGECMQVCFFAFVGAWLARDGGRKGNGCVR